MSVPSPQLPGSIRGLGLWCPCQGPLLVLIKHNVVSFTGLEIVGLVRLGVLGINQDAGRLALQLCRLSQAYAHCRYWMLLPYHSHAMDQDAHSEVHLLCCDDNIEHVVLGEFAFVDLRLDPNRPYGQCPGCVSVLSVCCFCSLYVC
jgi:hypothetical protein